MKRVIVKNKAGVQTHGAEMADPTEWIAEQKALNSWGKPQREVTADQEDVSGAISQREETDPLTGETRTLYTLPAEYTVEVQDMTAEVAAKKAKEAELEALKAQLRNAPVSSTNSVAELRTLVFAMAKILGLRD